MKTYRGARTIDGIKVTVDGQSLSERYDLQRFTTSGFEWTYVGNEPRQLALALLADHLRDDQRAVALCDAFMRKVVAELDNDWELTSDDIEKAVADIGAA